MNLRFCSKPEQIVLLHFIFPQSQKTHSPEQHSVYLLATRSALSARLSQARERSSRPFPITWQIHTVLTSRAPPSRGTAAPEREWENLGREGGGGVARASLSYRAHSRPPPAWPPYGRRNTHWSREARPPGSVRHGVSEAPRDSAGVETLTRASYAKASKSRLEAKIDALMQSNASETPETALSSAAYGARQDCLSGFRKSLLSSALASRQKVSHDTHARNAPAGESFRHSLAPTTNFIARFQGVRWPCPIAMLLPSGI